MIKSVLYLSVIVVLVFGAFFLMAIAPYHIYTLTLTEGVNTKFLKMDPTNSVFYDGNSLEKPELEMMNDERLYETFHFDHFELPMPINHPIFSLIPMIKIEATVPRLGARFQNPKNVELFSFMVEKGYRFETTADQQKLFVLPFFKNYIDEKASNDVWADLFQKKLSLPSNEGKSFLYSLTYLSDVSYRELVYNLYVLYNRKFVLPETTKKFSYYKDRNIGIAELPSEDPGILVERVFVIEKGIIYPVLIKTKKDDLSANNFRSKFLREIRYKMTTTDSAISIYARYKQIPYSYRVDQQGMTYLYAAWSHDIDNRDFIRVIVLFLERGYANLKFLTPFYEFAYKKFGSSLSSESGYLNETAAEGLKRKISEQLSNEVKTEEEMSREKFEGRFATPEERIKYNLQKAKDNKINSDENGTSLSIE
ncbi:MAG: hypothetical protein K2Q18_19095 [Bdellovibrionales bacterium]|nr:hypothetical protein [Bdellovibrionales bacterium]